MKRIDSLAYKVIPSSHARASLVLCHGLLADHTMFSPIVPSLQSQYNLFMPDFWWHGNNLPAPLPVSLRQQAELVAKMIQQEVNRHPVHLLGYSMGGVIAQLVAIQFPHLIDSLILCCTFAFKPVTPRERLEKRLFIRLIERIGPRGLALVSRMPAFLLGVSQVPNHLLQRYRSNLARVKPTALIQYIEELYTIDLRPFLPQIQHPTCVIGGTADFITPFHHAEFLASQIPNATLIPIKQADHILIFTHTTTFLNAIQSFFSQWETKS